MTVTPERLALHADATRIASKLSAVLDGEPSLAGLYASLSVAAHCAVESDVAYMDAVNLFGDMLRIGKRAPP